MAFEFGNSFHKGRKMEKGKEKRKLEFRDILN